MLLYDKYDKVSAQQKLQVAEEMIKAYPTEVGQDGKVVSVKNYFKTVTQIKKALDKVIERL